MRWRTPLFLGAAVLAAAGAISAFIAFGAPFGDDPPPLDVPPEILAGLPPETIVIPPPPVELTPVPAAEGGRTDCPQDWAVYADPGGYFSICYPQDWVAISGPPDGNLGAGFTLRPADTLDNPTESVRLALHWTESSPFDLGVISDRCGSEVTLRDANEVVLTFAGQKIPVCVGDVPDPEAGDPDPSLFRGTTAEIPVAPDNGYIRMHVVERKSISGARADLLSTILDSLRVGQ